MFLFSKLSSKDHSVFQHNVYDDAGNVIDSNVLSQITIKVIFIKSIDERSNSLSTRIGLDIILLSNFLEMLWKNCSNDIIVYMFVKLIYVVDICV